MTAQPTQRNDAREQLDRALTFVKRSIHFWWVVPLAMFIGGGICAAVLMIRQPDFMSETVMLYTEGVRPPDPSGHSAPNPRNNAVRMKEMLFSRGRLEKVISEFNLYPDERAERGMPAAVDEFRKDIIFKAPGTDTFTIGYVGKSADQAKRVTERLAQSLQEEEGALRQQQAQVTREFLGKERTQAERQLRDRERELAEFLAKNPGFALDTAIMTGAPSSGAAIRAATAQSRANASSSAPQQSTVVITRGGAPAPAPVAGPDPQLLAQRQAAHAALSAARANLTEQLARYTEQHPAVRAAKANVARAESQLLSIQETLAARTAPSAAESPASAPQRRTVVVRRAPPKTEKDKEAAEMLEKDLVALETEWTRLTRDVQEARVRQDQLEAAFFKADMMASSESGGHGAHMQVIDPAFLPTRPMPPGRMTILALALLASMLLGLGVMAALTAVDDRVYDARDAGAFAPVLIEVPVLRAPARRLRHA